MKHYILRRVAEIIPTTFGVLVLTFLLFHVVGGSPAEIVLGKSATAEALAAYDARFGYDKPLLLGRWAAIHALAPITAPELKGLNESRQDGRRVELPLTYALPSGNYRINVGQVLLHLRDVGSGEADEAMIDGPAPLTFVIKAGWRVERLEVGGAAVGRVKIEKGNTGLFDTQFVNYLLSLLKGDMGVSTEHSLPVAQVLRSGVGPSLALTVPILLGGAVLGVLLGLLCAAWRGGVVDRVILVVSTLLMSVNYVVWVLAGQFILAYKLRLFPIWGYESVGYTILPVLIGIVSGLGRDVRFYRAVILDEVFKHYVRTAQAKGVSGARIMLRHVLRNSLIPIVTYISLSVPFLFTGSLMLESFFGIPGLGSVSLNAIHSSDMAVVRAVVILGALLYQGVNLVTDLCYVWLDPRVRLG